MTVSTIIEEAKKLTPKEQATVVDALLDSMLPHDPRSDLELTPGQRADLDMRIEEAQSGKAEFIDGDEVMRRLRTRDDASI